MAAGQVVDLSRLMTVVRQTSSCVHIWPFPGLEQQQQAVSQESLGTIAPRFCIWFCHEKHLIALASPLPQHPGPISVPGITEWTVSLVPGHLCKAGVW